MNEPDVTIKRIVLKSDTEVFAANSLTPAGGIDLQGLIQGKLDDDEHIVWHGHALDGGLMVRMGFSAIGSVCLLYLGCSALNAIFSSRFDLGNALVFSFVALLQFALAGWMLFNAWQEVVKSKHTLYAVSNKRAFKVRPAGSRWTRFTVPDSWEMRTYSPQSSIGDGTEQADIHKIQAERLGQEFLAEFRQLPGANEALDRLKKGQP
jgi:hypothetical protein